MPGFLANEIVAVAARIHEGVVAASALVAGVDDVVALAAFDGVVPAAELDEVGTVGAAVPGLLLDPLASGLDAVGILDQLQPATRHALVIGELRDDSDDLAGGQDLDQQVIAGAFKLNLVRVEVGELQLVDRIRPEIVVGLVEDDVVAVAAGIDEGVATGRH